MRTLIIAVRALAFMAGFVFLWGWIALGVRPLDSELGVVLPVWTETLGVVLIAAGGTLVLLCGAVFVARGRGTPAAFDPPREFVAVGPYRYVRNPMYIGGVSVLLGFGLYLGSVAILILSAACFLLFHLFVLWYEEPHLRRIFGARYEQYLSAVNRWVPHRPGTLPAVFLVALVWAGPLSGADSKPNFSGEWKADLSKSDYGPVPAPLSRTDKIDHKEPSVKIARTQANRQGESSAEISCTTDGKECATTVRGVALKLKTTARWDGDVLVFDSKGAFNDSEVRILERWTLSRDGKAITVNRRLAGQEGEAHQTIVMEKQW